MKIFDWLTSKIINRIERIGEFVLIIVALVLFLNYILDLSIFSPLIWILWAYLFLNIGLANIFKFLRNKDNPKCPKCQRRLIEIQEYECPKCGKLNFDKGK